MSVRSRLLIFCLLLAVVPLLLVGVFAYDHAGRALRASTFDRLVATNTLKRAELERWLLANQDSLEALAARPLVRTYAQDLVRLPPATAGYREAQERLLADHLPQFQEVGNFLELFVVGIDDGRILSSTDPALVGQFRGDRAYFRQGQRHTTSQAPALDGDQVAMYVGTPVRGRDGEPTAVLAGQLDMSEMSAIMAQGQGESKTEETYLVNPDGFLLTESRFVSGDPLQIAVESTGVDSCLAGLSGRGAYVDYRGVPVLGSFTWLPEREMCILTEVNRDEALAPVDDLRQRVLLVGGLVALLAGIGAVVLAASLARPVKKLVVGAEEMGAGNLGYRVAAERQDELGTLAGALNAMAGRLEITRREMRESEERYRILVETSPVPIAVHQRGEIVFVNQAAVRALGGEREEQFVGRRIHDFFHPDSREIAAQQLWQVYESGQQVEMAQEKLFRLDGTVLEGEVVGVPIRFGGEPAALLVFHDVTERNRAQQMLRSLNQELEARVAAQTEVLRGHEAAQRALLNAILDSVFLIEADGTLVVANETFARRMGREPEALPGTNVYDLLPATVAEQRRQQVQQVVETREPVQFEDRRFGRDIVNSVYPVFDEAGRVIRLAIYGRDVTELKRAEAELRAIFEAMPDLVLVLSREGEYLKVAAHELEQLARPEAELLGKKIDQIFPEEESGRFLEAIRQALTRKEPVQLEYTLPLQGGARWFLASIAPLGEDAVVWVARDITERKRAEAELQRSNEELQRFAYVASHDLQEPLRMVTSYLQLLQRRYQSQLDEDADDFIEYAVDGATRMKTLINDLLAYSRVGTRGQPFVPTDLEAELQRVLGDLALAIEDSAATVTHDPLPTVQADPSQMRQLLQNLIGNALKFRAEQPPLIHVGAEQQNGQWIFSVRDNGIGLDPQFQERIFAIFQRLHPIGIYPGTGIGLAICKKIVDRHGGQIWVESEPGQGATFWFTLPARNEHG